MFSVGSTEALRGELQGLDILMLAADPDVPDHRAAAVMLGLHPRAESDGEPGQPYCGWCGRSDVPLEDQQPVALPRHECSDSADCQPARAERPNYWMDRQFKVWPIDLDKLQRMQAVRGRAGRADPVRRRHLRSSPRT